MSARLVAARMMTPLLVPKPSISVSSWFRVFSRSSFEFQLLLRPRARPMASISSMKMMHGAFSFACLNRSRTRDAPTPTNISTKSEPDREKNGTCASPATALASSVLPVPGGPTSSAPFGILPPNCVYFCGFFRKSTISFTSILASSSPATSLKSIFISEASLSNIFARDLPMLKIWLPPAPPDIRRNMNNQTPISSNGKTIQLRIGPRRSWRVSYLTSIGSSGEYFSVALAKFCSNDSTEPIVKKY